MKNCKFGRLSRLKWGDRGGRGLKILKNEETSFMDDPLLVGFFGEQIWRLL